MQETAFENLTSKRFTEDEQISQFYTTDNIVSEIQKIAERLITEISWQKGDILIVDNTRIMHGRRAFSDNQRDIYLRLCSPAFPF